VLVLNLREAEIMVRVRIVVEKSVQYQGDGGERANKSTQK